MPKLLISGRGGEKVHAFEGREVVLGSDAACDIVVQGGDVSPEHCKIQPVMGAWKIVDLESDAGTRVNGAYVNQRPLRTGDVLELGDVRMVFQDEAPAVAPTAPAARGGGAPAARSGGTSARRAGGRKAAAARAAPARGGRSARGGRGGRDAGEPERERPARRTRRQSSNSGTTVLFIIGALIVLAGGGYLVLKPKTSPNERVFMRMRQAEQSMDWQAVLREAQAGNTSDPEFGQRIAELKATAERNIQMDAAREKLGDATKSWNAVRAWRQDDNWHNDDEYVKRLDAFLAEYGRFGGASVDIARQERAKVAGSAEAGEAATVTEAWARLQADTQALAGNGQFGQALEACDAFDTKWGSQDRNLQQQARQLKTTLRDDAVKWMGKQISRAQHKLDQGTKFQARKILEKAAQVVGIPELEDRAAQALRDLIQ